MKISKLSYGYMRNAKSFDVSSNYVFLYTGRRVLILDRKLNFISEIDNLYYAYHGVISPDESKLLVVSNSNKFYIISLENLSLRQYSVRGKYNGNLEGMGCWSRSNNHIYIPVQNDKSMRSTLRKYNIASISEFEDLLPEKYWIIHISFVKSQEKYLLIGLDRDTQSFYIIWFDEKKFEYYPIKGFDEAILDVVVNEQQKMISIFGIQCSMNCNFKGENIKHFSVPLGKQHLNFKDNLANSSINSETKKETEILVANLGLNNIVATERINTASSSSDSRIIYIGTTNGLIIANAVDQSIIKRVNFQYGIQKIYELEDNILLLGRFNGIVCLKIDEID